MAKLKNLDKVFTLENGESVTVGHNRLIERIDAKTFVGLLHGNCVFKVTCSTNGEAFMVLDSCGYHTTTTRAAINDFMQAFGVSGSVSFAGGKFTARVKLDGQWFDKTARSDGHITAWADRFAV